MKPEEIIRAATFMLAVDGKIDATEAQFLQRLCRRFNVPEAFIQTAIAQMQAGNVTLALPPTPEEQIQLFDILAQAAAADGQIAPQELSRLQALAAKIGLPEHAVTSTLKRHAKKPTAKRPLSEVEGAGKPNAEAASQSALRLRSGRERPATQRCPKCDYEFPANEASCPACGIVAAKYLKAANEGKDDSEISQQRGDSSRLLKTGVKLLFLISLLLFGVAYCQQSKLPPKSAVLKPLYQEPVQKEVKQPPFQVNAGGTTYTITPLYSYELAGLVVSYHHSASFADYYHELWGDKLNLKDICVVWGKNIATNAYRESKFKSAPFMCYWWVPSDVPFDQSAISNNHLISEKKAISRQIMRAKTGDQIYLKGFLAEYSTAEGFHRGTSTTRDDTWNGACETIYLSEFRILKAANTGWRVLAVISKWLLFGSAGVLIFMFARDIFQTAGEYAKKKERQG